MNVLQVRQALTAAYGAFPVFICTKAYATKKAGGVPGVSIAVGNRFVLSPLLRYQGDPGIATAGLIGTTEGAASFGRVIFLSSKAVGRLLQCLKPLGLYRFGLDHTLPHGFHLASFS